MNIYFLVEGKTELKVYPSWISYLLPSLSRVEYAQDAQANNYYLISGLGYPRLLDVTLVDSVAEINELGNYKYLILVIDTDEMDESEKAAEIYQFIEDKQIFLNQDCQLHIITQKSCIETWFLGNRKVYTQNIGSHSDFYYHAKFYDVSQRDPEAMGKPEISVGSVSNYHEVYLRKMLAEKNIRYSKSHPKEVGETHFLEQLQKRVSETEHLISLKSFFTFCKTVANS